MGTDGAVKRLSNLLATRLVPHRFLAEQLRRPSGPFGRWVMARGLNSGNSELIGATLELLDLAGGDALLDVGFGGGLSLRLAAERSTGPMWGIDVSPDMVAQGHRYLSALVREGRLNLMTADAADLPLRDRLVSAACTINTIYFWPDLPAALRELRRVLTEGGRLAIGYSGPDKMADFDNITQHDIRAFAPPELESALAAAGFDRIHTTALHGTVTAGDFVTLAHCAD